MVDFIAASPLRIETTDEGTHILATVDGIQRTMSESSLRRNLKLRDEDGIVSISDTELFENLTLMGYNISQNQKLTFQKGTLTEPHHTPFPEADTSSHPTTSSILLPSIPTAPIPPVTQPDTIPIRQYSRRARIAQSSVLPTGEGSGTPTEPHHTPSQEAQPSSPTHISTSSIPTVIPIPTVTQSEPTPLRQYTRRVKIAQSSALPPVADEPASLVRDVSAGEACPTDSGFIADQDRATIAKSFTLPHDTAPRVTSPLLLRAFQAQKVKINKLNVRVKILEDNRGVIGTRSADDAPIKGRRINEEEEEMATVLTSMDAATVLAGGIDVPTGSYSIPTAGPPVVDIHTGSDAVPTASPIVATATVVTPYSRRKEKKVMMESDTPKRQRLQEQIDAQVARELEEQQERKDKRM
nr:hypothetical protein [Tanacetum cinerariifolium]